ncbi:hypothetical protein RQP46_011044 [Phenoliferia psychrophenolica]
MPLDVAATLKKLTLNEKVLLLAGKDNWHTVGIHREGVDVMALRMSDGPNGVRGTKFTSGVPASCFPCGAGLASTWNTKLIEEVGACIGEECHVKSVHVLLGPTCNLARSPLGGRAFEGYGEDPTLSGLIAAAFQEFLRTSSSSNMTPATLREVYLKPFEIAVRDAHPKTFMTGYNKVNGVHMSENKQLLSDVLRGEWGWDGLVMSDWLGVYSTAPALLAGLDLEMPGPGAVRGTSIHRAIAGHTLSVANVDERVTKVIDLVAWCEKSGIPEAGPEAEPDSQGPTRELLLRTAVESICLLKNDAGVLPLSPTKARKVAVIGPNALRTPYAGGGSASLLSTFNISILDGIKSVLPTEADISYHLGASIDLYLPTAFFDSAVTATGDEGFEIEMWNSDPLLKDSKPVFTTTSRGSYILFNDGIPPEVNLTGWASIRGFFTPAETEDVEVGLAVAGQADLYIDGKLVLENSKDQVRGNLAFNTATVEKRAVVSLIAGQRIEIVIKFSNFNAIPPSVYGGDNWAGQGGVRLGAAPVRDPQQLIDEATALAKEAEVVILAIGLSETIESEGFDRADLKLPGYTNALVSAILAAKPDTVVVHVAGTPNELPWIAGCSTLIHAPYGGNAAGQAVADVVFGLANPSGHLSMSWPHYLEDVPSFLTYGGDLHTGQVDYSEGLFIGWKGYEAINRPPLFSFGHGLAYSELDIDLAPLTPLTATSFAVDLVLTNLSPSNDASFVVQVYIAPPTIKSDGSPRRRRPKKDLVAFEKVALVGGKRKAIQIAVGPTSLATWDEKMSCWVVEKGTYGVQVGTSSADIRAKDEWVVEQELVWAGLGPV